MGRRDAIWSEACLYNMIDIFLNPDNETLGGEVLDTITDSNPNFALSSTDKADAELAASIAAGKLLKELQQNPTNALRAQVSECYIMMAPKQKEQVESACQKLMELLEKEREFIPALLVRVLNLI
jgi:tetratricopeptide repeat protein 21B